MVRTWMLEQSMINMILDNSTLFPVLHDLYLAASLTEQNLSTVINSTESWKVYFIWSSQPDIINNSISPPLPVNCDTRQTV